jgi:ParB-like chromosome segregation protein Spo0J
MTPEQVIKHFGTQELAAQALGFRQSAVSNWLARGKVPPISQLKLEIITDGKLKADKRILAVPKRKVSRA